MKISVIIPCYNVERYLGECLDSVLAAAACSCADIEVIAVDDGSTDATGAILDAYGEKAEGGRLEVEQRSVTFKVIHKANGGEGSARNAGLDVATGDWLMFIDSDDVIAERTFNDILEAMGKYPEGDLIRVSTSAFEDGEKPTWTGSGAMVCEDIRNALPPAVCMYGVTEMSYRCSVFGSLRFGDYKVGADLVFTSQCFGVAKTLVSIDHANYGYRVRPNSMAHCAMTPVKMQDKLAFLTDMLKNFIASGKALPYTIKRGRGNMLLEECPSEILIHREGEWLPIWHQWLNAISLFRHNAAFSRWQRTVAFIIATTRSRFLTRLLCCVPHQLKLKGFHR